MTPEQPRITLRQLEIFQAIVVAGSFTRATALTDLSQPTLSQQLASLERELKTQLVIRDKKSAIELTPAGEFWLTRAAEITGLVEESLTTHEHLFIDQGITINFGTTPSLQGRFDELIASAAIRIPQIKSLNINSYLNSKHVADALLAHKINLGIGNRSDFDVQKSSLHIERLYDDKIVWAVPRSVPVQDVLDTLRAGSNVHHHPCLDRYVTLGRIAPWNKRTADWFRHNTPFAQPYFKSATHLSAVQIAASGHATCHTPMTPVPNLSDGVRQRLNFFDVSQIGREVCLAFPRHLLTMKAFLDFTTDIKTIIHSEFKSLESPRVLCRETPIGILDAV